MTRAYIMLLYIVPVFALIQQVLLSAMSLTNLSLMLVTPMGTQKEWFIALIVFQVEEPPELPMVWNVLVQPHIRKFHKGLETLDLQLWKPSNNSSTRQAFVKKLWKSSQLMSEHPQHVSTRESDQDSSTGIVEGILLHARPQFTR